MKRPVAALVLTALSMLVGLRLAVAVQDTAAMRCAIACGHTGSAGKGAACCPMTAAPGTAPSFKTCAGGDGLALIPLATGQPALLATATPMTAPAMHRFLDAPTDADPRFAPPRPLDHVPLLFG